MAVADRVMHQRSSRGCTEYLVRLLRMHGVAYDGPRQPFQKHSHSGDIRQGPRSPRLHDRVLPMVQRHRRERVPGGPARVPGAAERVVSRREGLASVTECVQSVLNHAVIPQWERERVPVIDRSSGLAAVGANM